MQVKSFAKLGLAAGALLLLGSCGDSIGGGFQSQYAVARNALEVGDYARAKRGYQKLLAEAGPLAPRLQLEYAHTELRAGNYAEAAQLAGSLAQSQSGEARAAALAVQGTAQHELGMTLLSQNDFAGGKQQLVQAQAALAEVLKSNPDLDPLGAMAGRRASIEVRLKAL